MKNESKTLHIKIWWNTSIAFILLTLNILSVTMLKLKKLRLKKFYLKFLEGN